MVSDMQKYYLTAEKDVGKKLQTLLRSTGFRQKLVSLLLNNNLSDEAILEGTKTILMEETKTALGSSVETYIDQVINLLPKNLRNRTKMMAPIFQQIVSVDESGRVVYKSTGIKGGYIVDHIRYFLTGSGQFSSAAPEDVGTMRESLRSLQLPKSLFGKGKWPGTETTDGDSNENVDNWISF